MGPEPKERRLHAVTTSGVWCYVSQIQSVTSSNNYMLKWVWKEQDVGEWHIDTQLLQETSNRMSLSYRGSSEVRTRTLRVVS